MPKEQMMCPKAEKCYGVKKINCITNIIDHSVTHEWSEACGIDGTCPSCIPYEPVEPAGKEKNRLCKGCNGFERCGVACPDYGGQPVASEPKPNIPITCEECGGKVIYLSGANNPMCVFTRTPCTYKPEPVAEPKKECPDCLGKGEIITAKLLAEKDALLLRVMEGKDKALADMQGNLDKLLQEIAEKDQTIERLTSEVEKLEDTLFSRVERIKELESDNKEYEQTFDMIQKASTRAIEMWREAHPGHDLESPDTAKLCVWLMEQNKELEEYKDSYFNVATVSTQRGERIAVLEATLKARLEYIAELEEQIQQHREASFNLQKRLAKYEEPFVDEVSGAWVPGK